MAIFPAKCRQTDRGRHVIWNPTTIGAQIAQTQPAATPSAMHACTAIVHAASNSTASSRVSQSQGIVMQNLSHAARGHG